MTIALWALVGVALVALGVLFVALIGRYIIQQERRIATLEAERKPTTLDDIPQRLGYNQRRDMEDAIAVLLRTYQEQQLSMEYTETALDMLRNIRAGRAEVKPTESGHGWKVKQK